MRIVGAAYWVRERKSPATTGGLTSQLPALVGKDKTPRAFGLVDTAPPVTPQDLERAKALREAMFRLVATLINHQTPSATDCALVNAAAEASPPVLRLDDDGLHRCGDADAVLALLARDCLDLFDSPDRAALHWCADASCTRPFIDRSRGQRRRWCGMKGCGDRAKAAAYRRRRRTSLDNQTARDPAR